LISTPGSIEIDGLIEGLHPEEAGDPVDDELLRFPRTARVMLAISGY
jgi:hypothetical protein